MDFSLSPELSELRRRVRAFMDERVLPAEAAVIAEDRERRYDTLRALQAQAREAGLFVPHLPPEHGGLGLGIMGMCVLFREMGRSPVGARAFNCDAPDQGNMDLLLSVGTAAQKERYLAPLARAEITSAFCMTEPAPGAGADPSNLRTRATPTPDGGFVLSGHKWYSTGGEDAAFLIVMARTADPAPRDPSAPKGSARDGGEATLFLVERRAPGVEFVRNVATLAPELLAHREAEFRFHDVRVGPEAVLGRVGEGFRLAQVRLVPARLTHCMRWLGLAERALQLSRDYVLHRESFGRRLAEHQAIQAFIARGAEAIHAGNLMTFHCAWLLAQGQHREARAYSSMAKTHVARALCQVLDDAIQMHGSLGYSDDMPFAQWYRAARAARIADGPDEVHQMVIARDFLRGQLNLLV